MSIKEYREKSSAELRKELLDLRREQFNLRMAQASGEAAKPDQFGKVRRNIARLKTVLGEQARGVKVVSAAGESAPKKSASKPKSKSRTAKSKSA